MEKRFSPLSKNSLEKNRPLSRNSELVTDISILSPILVLSNGEKRTLKFGELVHINPAMSSAIVKLAKLFGTLIRDGHSTDSLASIFLNLRRYINFCVKKGVNPSLKTSYKLFNLELYRLVEIASNPLPYIYMYEHGDELGILESTAAGIAQTVKTSLLMCNLYTPEWDQNSIAFKDIKTPTTPYTRVELESLLYKLHTVFFDLAAQLIAFNKENKHDVPLALETVISDKHGDNKTKIPFTRHIKKYSSGKPHVSKREPFNFAMLIGYHLLCYYTNFNNGTASNLFHPFIIIEEGLALKTTKHLTLRGYKSRSKSEVTAVLSNIDLEPTLASIDKIDGITFFESLQELSLTYGPKQKNGPLFFQLDSQGSFANFNPNMHIINSYLGLYSASKKNHARYLKQLFFNALNEKVGVYIKQSRETQLIEKVQYPLNRSSLKPFLISSAFATARALTDIQLKNILMPLKYSELPDGKINISFLYSDGKAGNFDVEKEFHVFFEALEKYSLHYNPLFKQYKGGKTVKLKKSKKPSYLFPIGGVSNTTQWEGIDYNISNFLKKVGIYSGEYLLDINAKKFRVTNSNNFFDNTDDGVNIANAILQNSLGTLQAHYINGHKTENQIITFQALNVLEKWTKTGDISTAKGETISALKITVLAFDEWKSKRRPATNANGVLCGGNPTGVARTAHRKSQNIAQLLLGINTEIACYQYDKCFECKSAKLVDHVDEVYKLVSFIDSLTDTQSTIPERQEEFSKNIEYFNTILENNIPPATLDAAYERFFKKGRHPIHDNSYMSLMEPVNYA